MKKQKPLTSMVKSQCFMTSWILKFLPVLGFPHRWMSPRSSSSSSSESPQLAPKRAMAWSVEQGLQWTCAPAWWLKKFGRCWAHTNVTPKCDLPSISGPKCLWPNFCDRTMVTLRNWSSTRAAPPATHFGHSPVQWWGKNWKELSVVKSAVRHCRWQDWWQFLCLQSFTNGFRYAHWSCLIVQLRGSVMRLVEKNERKPEEWPAILADHRWWRWVFHCWMWRCAVAERNVFRTGTLLQPHSTLRMREVEYWVVGFVARIDTFYHLWQHLQFTKQCNVMQCVMQNCITDLTSHPFTYCRW